MTQFHIPLPATLRTRRQSQSISDIKTVNAYILSLRQLDTTKLQPWPPGWYIRRRAGRASSYWELPPSPTLYPIVKMFSYISLGLLSLSMFYIFSKISSLRRNIALVKASGLPYHISRNHSLPPPKYSC